MGGHPSIGGPPGFSGNATPAGPDLSPAEEAQAIASGWN